MSDVAPRSMRLPTREEIVAACESAQRIAPHATELEIIKAVALRFKGCADPAVIRDALRGERA